MTDRVELTDDEREALLCDVGCKGDHSRYCAASMLDVYSVEMDAEDLCERVESIVAARVQAVMGELEYLRERKDKYMAGLGERFGSEVTAMAERDAARAELAAANARLETWWKELENANGVRDKCKAERDALQARLDRVTALIPSWEELRTRTPSREAGELRACTSDLRAALSGSGTKDGSNDE